MFIFFFPQRCHCVTVPVTNPQPFVVCSPLVVAGDLTASLAPYSLDSSWIAPILTLKSHSSIHLASLQEEAFPIRLNTF